MKPSLATLASRLFKEQAIVLDAREYRHLPNPPALYLNFRAKTHPRGCLSAKTVNSIASEFFDVIERHSLPCDYICGVPDGANEMARSLAKITGVPLLKLSKELPGDSGTNVVFSCPKARPSGQKPVVILIENTLTTGKSLLQAVTAMRSAGYEVYDAFTVADHQRGASELLRTVDPYVEVHSLFTSQALIRYYMLTGQIEQEKAADLLRQLAKP